MHPTLTTPTSLVQELKPRPTMLSLYFLLPLFQLSSQGLLVLPWENEKSFLNTKNSNSFWKSQEQLPFPKEKIKSLSFEKRKWIYMVKICVAQICNCFIYTWDQSWHLTFCSFATWKVFSSPVYLSYDELGLTWMYLSRDSFISNYNEYFNLLLQFQLRSS